MMDNLAMITPSTVKISLPWRWRPVKRRMLPGCELFADGDAFLHYTRKFVPLEVEEDETSNSHNMNIEKEIIPCSVIGCSQVFTSLLGYENHYNTIHRHTCLTCHRAFPSAFLLDIHIQENHDPLFAILVHQQSMYRCLVESCMDKFASCDSRRQHMIKVHHFPSNFRFHRLKPATSSPRIKQESCKVMDTEVASAHNPRNSTPSTEPQQSILPVKSLRQSSPTDSKLQTGASASRSNEETVAAGYGGRQELCPAGAGEDQGSCMDVDESVTEKVSPSRRVFVHKVPQNVSFGHGVSRGFQRPPGKKKGKGKKHWHQLGPEDKRETTTSIETVDMTDMVEALNA